MVDTPLSTNFSSLPNTNVTYRPSQPAPNSKKKMTVIIIVFLIAAAVIGGYFMFRQPAQNNKEAQISPTEIKEPTPTQKPKIDKGSVKVQVLNGTGAPGQAGTAVEALKKAGFNADNIKTANAEEFKDSATTISMKDGFEEIAVDVQNALKSTFNDITIESKKLESTSEFDVVVVTGGKKYEEKITPTTIPTTPVATSGAATATPTSSATPTPTP